MQDKIVTKAKAVLVGIAGRTSEVEECERSLDELERLLDTAGGECFAKLLQVKESFDPRTCIGSGKVKELCELCENNGIELVVFDFNAKLLCASACCVIYVFHSIPLSQF